MITIRQIRAEEAHQAKRLVLTVAQGIYQWDRTVEQVIQDFEQEGILQDMDDIQSEYINNRGEFLVALDDDKLIGTGALHCIDNKTCELKRMWLLEPYHGQGIGYAMISQLLDFARENGYTRVELKTDRHSERAIHFYHQVGFQSLEQPSDDPDLRIMAMDLP